MSQESQCCELNSKLGLRIQIDSEHSDVFIAECMIGNSSFFGVPALLNPPGLLLRALQILQYAEHQEVSCIPAASGDSLGLERALLKKLTRNLLYSINGPNFPDIKILLVSVNQKLPTFVRQHLSLLLFDPRL